MTTEVPTQEAKAGDTKTKAMRWPGRQLVQAGGGQRAPGRNK